ncbi:hypothetical protein [Planomonospora alba]
MLPVRPPGRVFAAFRAGAHPAPEHRDGRRAFAEFLAEGVERAGYAGPGR